MPIVFQVCFLNTNTRLSSDFRAWDIYAGDGATDAPALSRANVGVAVEGATDAARGTADIVLTEPGLSTIVHAIRQSRIIFHRMRNYAIYAW